MSRDRGQMLQDKAYMVLVEMQTMKFLTQMSPIFETEDCDQSQNIEETKYVLKELAHL